MRIYVDTPAYFLRPRTNTDWRYMRELQKMGRYIPIDFHYPLDIRDIVHAHRPYWNKLLPQSLRTTSPKSGALDPTRQLSQQALIKAKPDIIYSHRHHLPTNVRDVPLIWFYSVADPDMQRGIGISDKEIEAQYLAQAENYALASRVQVTTEAEVRRHVARFPQFAEKFCCVPWFRPDLIALSAEQIETKHFCDDVVRILFVGRQAHRKGLDLLLQALRHIPPAERALLHLDVVTTFSDGRLELDADFSCCVRKEVGEGELRTLFRNAHIYAMPCRFETFGLVFVEAMSQGCAVLGPNWEVQREIFDEGSAGVPTDLCKERICAALRRLCFDRDHRLSIAINAFKRFLSVYSPEAVAHSYYRMFLGSAQG
jgi:glycosyltransferase involved in cell wall biosynthesis